MHCRWAPRTQYIPALLASRTRGPPGSSLTSCPNASSRFPALRGGTAAFQTRRFHDTSVRSLGITGTLVACAVGASGITCIVRFTTGGRKPPHTWARTADKRTRDDVEAALTVGFHIARSRPPRQRNNALREATFHVPRELARLNKDAPDFRLEEVGPIARAKVPGFTLSIDYWKETRVFLYFPNGATKATAIFVAVNAELKCGLRKMLRSGAGEAVMDAARGATEVSMLMTIWEVQHKIWARSHPAVIDRIEELERLPIVFNFREEAFGVMYYRRLGFILDPTMCATPLDTTNLDRSGLLW